MVKSATNKQAVCSYSHLQDGVKIKRAVLYVPSPDQTHRGAC